MSPSLAPGGSAVVGDGKAKDDGYDEVRKMVRVQPTLMAETETD